MILLMSGFPADLSSAVIAVRLAELSDTPVPWTDQDTLFQPLPADPEEAVGSITKKSHTPTSEGAEMDTDGAIGKSGALT
jgi:hypothetical protein